MWVLTGGLTNTLAYNVGNGFNPIALGSTIFEVGYSVAWNGSLWVAAGSSTNTLAYSHDGSNWTGLGNNTFPIDAYSVGWNGAVWVAGGYGSSNNNTLAYSHDGSNWTGLGKSVFDDFSGSSYGGSITARRVLPYVGTTVVSSNNLPAASQYGNYLFYNGTYWITGSTIVSIGDLAGAFNQGVNAVAIGAEAGYSNQSTNSVAVGYQAGYTSQDSNAVAIGAFAGYSNQGVNTIAIGNDAGLNNQGDYAIAIGNNAGTTGQAPSSIILNASSANLEASNSGFYVQPIRNDDTLSNSFLQYDTLTGEIVYNAVKTFVIDHPTSASKYLVHACLEGPEAGVYYRGKGEVDNAGEALINLPSYVDAFATELTVNVTPIYNGNVRTLNATEVCSNQFKVFGNPGPFHWHVYGKRQSIIVEPDKSNVELKGSGPYKWLA